MNRCITMALKEIWQGELNKEIRKRIMKNMSVRVKENGYKVIWRQYLTPMKLNTLNKKVIVCISEI